MLTMKMKHAVRALKVGGLILGLTASLPSFAGIEVQQFDSPEQESTYRSLIAELRCPQCQNNNIADSNATIATDMRAKTLELLKQGKSREEVVQYMVDRYGNFVTYDPPLNETTLIIWALPIGLILVGSAMILLRRRKPQTHAETHEHTAPDAPAQTLDRENQQRLDAILNDKDH